MTTTKSGYFLIADITGYTAYLSESELEHAQETLSTLLTLLIEHTRPPLVISRLAGDAVISYAMSERITQGQTFVEMLEDTYVAFRRAIELMVLNNTCKCNACANVGSLDLKFFVHHGVFGIQHLDEHDELVGSDVNLIHRLLKNRVFEETGLRAYTLYTDAAIRKLGLEEISATLTRHSESYEHLGEVQVWVQDMHPVWHEKRDATRITIPPGDILIQLEVEIAMSREWVWDYLTRPEFRSVIVGSDRQVILNKAGGRVAPDSVYQCFHGDKINYQTILEWVPFERLVTNDLLDTFPIKNSHVLNDIRLEPTKRGTRLVETFAKSTAPLLGRLFLRLLTPTKRQDFQNGLDAFKELIEDDWQARGGPVELDSATIPTPEEIDGAAAAGLKDA
jgi:uncharacterized protein YndB with AHSA1/START domain